MSLWTDLRGHLDAIVNRDIRDRETREEMAFHMQMQAQTFETARSLPSAMAPRSAVRSSQPRVRCRSRSRTPGRLSCSPLRPTSALRS